MGAAWVGSIQAGMPRRMGGGAAGESDPPWISGYVKEPVSGAVWVGNEHVAGDAQADLQNHGGVHRVVLAYAASHYPLWREELGRDFPFGAFGENFTVEGLTEADVCVGDTYRVGGAILQVSEPRIPCWKISRRWHVDDLLERVVQSGRVGWFHRVLSEGAAAAGDALQLLDRPHPRLTIAAIYRAHGNGGEDAAALAEIAACPLLSPRVRTVFARRAGAAAADRPPAG